MQWARWVILGVLVSVSALAQTSPSYNLEEYRMNQGGDPRGGVALQSASYQVSLDAVGDSVGGPGPTSASYNLDSGVEALQPPGEVVNLRFTSKTTLTWDAELSVGSYNLYRAVRSDLPTGPGSCLQSALASPTGTDASDPGSGICWYYLVTAENRIREEGTSGRDSAGTVRPNPTPCP